MEYLARLLQHTTTDEEFKFHPLCKLMRLSSLMFADDLLLFNKGDMKSIMVLLRTFATFSASSELKLSNGKSNVYFSGVTATVRQDVIDISGCQEGNLPFKYLGVPIKASRLTIHDCQPLVYKITDRIRNLGARKLSYVGRLILIKSVLNTLHKYWASIFVLPNGIIKQIEGLRRTYLWEGGVTYTRSPLVSWHTICLPYKEGGLNVLQNATWNKAAVGKLAWWIYTKPDKLWVRWVHHTYLRNTTWHEYIPNQNTSWSWRKICQVRELMQAGFVTNMWNANRANDYTIAKGYQWLRNKGGKVEWHNLVWSKWTIPKQRMVAWLQKMWWKILIATCGQEEEDIRHLFCRCDYSQQVLRCMEDWLGIKISNDLNNQWRLKIRGSYLRKAIINSMINAIIYHVWRQRNQSRNEKFVTRPGIVRKSAKKELIMYYSSIKKGKMSTRDNNLVERLMT